MGRPDRGGGEEGWAHGDWRQLGAVESTEGARYGVKKSVFHIHSIIEKWSSLKQKRGHSKAIDTSANGHGQGSPILAVMLES